MVGDELVMVRLKNDFYRDGFRKVILSLGLITVAIFLLAATSVYLVTSKPAPVNFVTDNEWRVLAPVPLNQYYLTDAEVVQWTAQVLQSIFTYDFYNYSRQSDSYRSYFTETGWGVYGAFLNNYAKKEIVTQEKLFTKSTALSAPLLIEKGVLQNRYSWLIEMQIKVDYTALNRRADSKAPTLLVTVVRVPTLNNINGVAIDSIVLRPPVQRRTTV